MGTPATDFAVVFGLGIDRLTAELALERADLEPAFGMASKPEL
jgi:hypothetical protein